MDLFDLLKLDYDKLYQYLYDTWDEDIDTKTSSTGSRMIRVLASVGFLNIVYLKKSFYNAVFSSCNDRNIAIKKARSEKSYKSLPVVSSYVSLLFTIPTPIAFDVIISQWTVCNSVGLDVNKIFNVAQQATIPVGATSVSALAVEGTRANKTFVAEGLEYESFTIYRTDVTLQEMVVTVNGVAWTYIDNIIDAESDDTVWTYEPGEDGKIKIMFGNDTYGKKLTRDAEIIAYYIVSSGIGGNIRSNCITEIQGTIYNSGGGTVDSITVNNPAKSYGGAPMQDITEVIADAYGSYMSNWGLVTLTQYEKGIKSLAGVSRCKCYDINTSLEIPFRTIWSYIADSNGDDIDEPYRQNVLDYVASRGVCGNEFHIEPISYTNYDVEVNIWTKVGYVQATVQTAVLNAITDNFSASSLDIGEDISVSSMGAVINDVEGLSYYDIILPSSNITVPDGYIGNIVTIAVNIMGVL